MFLGTPHVDSESGLDLNILDVLLRSEHKYLPKSAFQKEDEDNNSLRRICREFESVNLQVPVVSVCERETTKIAETKFTVFRKSKHLVVSRSTCNFCRNPVVIAHTISGGTSSNRENKCEG